MTKKTFSVIKNYFFQFSKQGFDSSEIVIFVTRIISCFYKFDYSHSMLWGGLIPFFQPAFESNPFFPCKFKLDMWCISWMEGMKISIANTGLTLFCIMLKNGQTYFKTFWDVHAARFSKYVWPFVNIKYDRVNSNLFMTTDIFALTANRYGKYINY